MERIVLFAKRPDPGRVKTRLEATLGRAGALSFYRALLGDALDRLVQWREAGLDVEVCLDRVWTPNEETHAAIPRTSQGPGDLGARLLRAMLRCQEDGARATLVLGADAPTLPGEIVERALGALRSGADAVVAPADDGGYVLVGGTRAVPELFREVPWGGPGVLAMTRRRARRAGVELAEVDGWYDVDDASSLERLRTDLAIASFARLAPRTARWLRQPGHGGGP